MFVGNNRRYNLRGGKKKDETGFTPVTNENLKSRFVFLFYFLSPDTFSQGEPRVLGLAMIPGHHVVSIEVEADSLEEAQGFGANH